MENNDMKELEAKEIITKLYDISGQIIALYNQLIEVYKNGSSDDKAFSLTLKLKINILMEERIVCSLSMEKIKECSFLAFSVDDDFRNTFEQKYPDVRSGDVGLRISNLLYGREKILLGQSIKLPVRNNGYMFFCTVDLLEAFLSILSLKRIKELLLKGDLNTNISEEMKSDLLKEIYIDMVKLFKRCRAMELLFFLFASEPNLESLTNNDMEMFESLFFKEANDSVEVILGNLGLAVVSMLSKLEIDISEDDFVDKIDSSDMYKYLFNMIMLENILFYCDKDTLEHIYESLDATHSVDNLNFLEEQMIEKYFNNYVGDLSEQRLIDFQSDSIEEIVREKIEEYKNKNRRK